MKEIFQEIKKTIDDSNRILLVSHKGPDGDALGSMLALKIVFGNLGKEADIFCPSAIPEVFLFLPEIQSRKTEVKDDYDLIFGLDYADINHLETITKDNKLALPEISFDHHPFVNQTGRLKIIDPSFSCTCEIVHQFLAINSLPLNKEIATCLLTGIFTDTWSFRHPNTSRGTLKTAAELIAKGALLNKIAKLSTRPDMEVKPKIWARALEKTTFESGFIYCFLNYQDLQEFQAKPSEISGLANLLCGVPEARFSLVLNEIMPGFLDGSLRALPDKGIDVSSLAKEFGGGGHKLSAGFKIEARPETIIKRIRILLAAQESANV